MCGADRPPRTRATPSGQNRKGDAEIAELPLSHDSAQPVPALDTAQASSHTYGIISRVSYLLGVPTRIFKNPHEPPQWEVYELLEKNRNARIIRHLCTLRTAIERNFDRIHDKMKFEFKTITSMPELVPAESISQLSQDGVDVARRHSRLVQYVVEINRQITDRINNCRELFPLWLNWAYLRNIFIMPGGLQESGPKEAIQIYYQKQAYYPYQVYLNWPASDSGNILYHDKKFVALLYQWNHDVFTDISKVSDTGRYAKASIYDFLAESKQTVLVVDCENSDPYNLYAALQNLNSDTLAKISKIILFDDVHAATAWDLLDNYLSLPVERMLIERIKQNKSLVDIRLTAEACREHYQNQVDSFIIVSSDSDYWALISSLPKARFLVMVEHEKCGFGMKAALAKAGIFYCYIDDFYSGASEELKFSALLRELHRYIQQSLHLNVNAMMESAFQSTRIVMSDAEKRQFYNQYIKPMHLVIAKNGDVSIELRGR